MSRSTGPFTNPDERIWHSVKTATTYSGYSARTILDALRDGSLKGAQRTEGGTWRIHVDDLDAWLRGERPAPAKTA